MIAADVRDNFFFRTDDDPMKTGKAAETLNRDDGKERTCLTACRNRRRCR